MEALLILGVFLLLPFVHMLYAGLYGLAYGRKWITQEQHWNERQSLLMRLTESNRKLEEARAELTTARQQYEEVHARQIELFSRLQQLQTK